MLDSVRVRLTLWYSAVLALVLLALAGAMYLLLARNALRSTDSNLSELADAFLTTVDAELESDTIVAAMQTKGIPVTYVVYPDEGHGFQKPPNRLSYIAIAEAFFARHLGGACEPVGNDFDGSTHEVRAGADLLADSVRTS